LFHEDAGGALLGVGAVAQGKGGGHVRSFQGGKQEF
jgi:hypothetical protein